MHHLLHPIARWYVASLALATLVLLSACALAAQPVDVIEPGELAQALTSGALGPTIGAAVILVAWVIGKYRRGVGLMSQLQHFFDSALPVLPVALATGGGAMLAGLPARAALAAAVTVLLAGANVRRPAPPALPPESALPGPGG